MLDIKLYEDGNRLIISLENPGMDMKSMVKAMLSAATGRTVQVTGLSPAPAPKDTGNPLTVPAPSPGIPDMDKAVRERGFEGFCAVCSFYKENYRALPEADKDRLCAAIKQYSQAMAHRNIAAIPDDELKRILRLGSKVVFPKAISSCLQQTASLSLEDFLESGRRNLEDAYRLCFPAA